MSSPDRSRKSFDQSDHACTHELVDSPSSRPLFLYQPRINRARPAALYNGANDVASRRARDALAARGRVNYRDTRWARAGEPGQIKFGPGTREPDYTVAAANQWLLGLSADTAGCNAKYVVVFRAAVGPSACPRVSVLQFRRGMREVCDCVMNG